MSLQALCRALADVCDDDLAIEVSARQALQEASALSGQDVSGSPLPNAFKQVLSAPDAHPVCDLIEATSLPWSAPQASDDPAYVAGSPHKLSVEFVGPDGLLTRSDTIRVGLYGIGPQTYYGYRTHPAEEVFVMLAGEADWAKGEAGFATLRNGERAHHPSMVRHATATRERAFLCLYVWRGDVSFDGYAYQGSDTG